MLDTCDAHKPRSRPLWIRLYQRFMDWLWHGPLTRDLHPRSYPSTLSQVFSLLRYIWQDGWSLLWQRLGRSRHPDT